VRPYSLGPPQKSIDKREQGKTALAAEKKRTPAGGTRLFNPDERERGKKTAEVSKRTYSLILERVRRTTRRSGNEKEKAILGRYRKKKKGPDL